jgi:hypothetical protein
MHEDEIRPIREGHFMHDLDIRPFPTEGFFVE